MQTESNPEQLSAVKLALLEIRALRAQLSAIEEASREPIAIVGMAVRLPGGIVTLESFWEILDSGQNCITEVPPERWDIDKHFSADRSMPGTMYSRCGGFLSDIDQFDPDFFGITAREARSMDPQQRLLLEVTWEALEDAGIAPSSLASSSASVYLGLANSDYGRMLLSNPMEIDAHSVIGGALSIASGRISYFLNARGPSMVVDTACSSSLVALHLACQALRAGQTELAIVGGANLILLPEGSIGFSRTHMLAQDGRCKVFDRDADGYVRGEGCVAIILKKRSDALKDGHRIRALVRGSAVNQDGRSAGLTAPNGPSQECVIRSALKAAGVRASEVSFVECHGTGTPLGDPIEVQSIAKVYGEDRDRDHPLRISSVKANIGHLEAAAGLAGVVKAVLALEHEAMPSQINLQHHSPHIPWSEIPVVTVDSNTSWSREGNARIAGVSSFGFSGTNVHLILEEAPLKPELLAVSDSPIHLLCLSARTPQALRDLAGLYMGWLARTEDNLGDICYTASVGRSHHSERLAVLGASKLEIQSQLRTWLNGEPASQVMTGSAFEERFSPSPSQGIADKVEQRADLMKNLQALYCRGAKIDWTSVYERELHYRVTLPTYPFQRSSFWLSPLPGGSRDDLAARSASDADIGDRESPRAVLQSLRVAERNPWMMQFVRGCIRQVLGLEAAFELGSRDRLTDLGMDSLIALELRSILAKRLDLGESISATIAFDAGTVEELSRILLEACFPIEAVEARAAEPDSEPEVHNLSLDEISELSDEQVEQLLASRLGKTMTWDGRP